MQSKSSSRSTRGTDALPQTVSRISQVKSRFDAVQEFTLCPLCVKWDRQPLISGTLNWDDEQSYEASCAACNGRTSGVAALRAVVAQGEGTMRQRQLAVAGMRRPTGIDVNEYVELFRKMATVAVENTELRKEVDRLRKALGGLDGDMLRNRVRALRERQREFVEKVTKEGEDMCAEMEEFEKTLEEIAVETAQGTDKSVNDKAGVAETEVKDGRILDSAEGHPDEMDASARISYRELAERHLPPSYKLSGLFEEIAQQQVPKIRAEFAQETQTSDDPFTEVKAIYVSGVRQAPIENLTRELRSIMPPQALLGVSLYGSDGMEVLVEMQMESYAREFLKVMGFRPTDRTQAIEADCEENRVLVVVARWHECLERTQNEKAKRWYEERLQEVEDKFPVVVGAVDEMMRQAEVD